MLVTNSSRNANISRTLYLQSILYWRKVMYDNTTFFSVVANPSYHSMRFIRQVLDLGKTHTFRVSFRCSLCVSGLSLCRHEKSSEWGWNKITLSSRHWHFVHKFFHEKDSAFYVSTQNDFYNSFIRSFQNL